ncbi:NAD(P)H-dependent oxidoreductase [Frateuria edaphi]|jgi:NAD(P)H-dependent FMN reductase|uniref:NADPH-dependent FMN reductase n=1 Tax=Frateuria edaphi TaxID=2898793 RepID=UPI001E5F7FA7|nr:NADPH-dependent FMN reductase [Frateuria edaphi]UGB46850.1 NAD(P)H-dependent oxidoreductase [Frateuria edaphi]
MRAGRKRVLCLSGSLRRRSSNTAALQAAQALAPDGLELVTYDGLGDLPLFNPDIETLAVPPQALALREAVGRADALLIACPEYAHGVPGAFKNLLDWLVGSLEFPGKPVALLNASGRGSHHAQESLEEILRTMSARVLGGACATVALPGAGCGRDEVLASPERCAELRSLLTALEHALAAKTPR